MWPFKAGDCLKGPHYNRAFCNYQFLNIEYVTGCFFVNTVIMNVFITNDIIIDFKS